MVVTVAVDATNFACLCQYTVHLWAAISCSAADRHLTHMRHMPPGLNQRLAACVACRLVQAMKQSAEEPAR